MYHFGAASKIARKDINCWLKLILDKAIKIVDFSILEGYRDQKTQDRYFKEGKSKVKFPDGKHNLMPSDAVDIAPYPYPKNEKELNQAYYLAGIVMGIASEYGIKIRIGCDWNSDGDIRNDKFQDVWHVELINE